MWTISQFSVDTHSQTYNSTLFYTGVDEMGEIFTLSAGGIAGFVNQITHFDIGAPTGGYITGFHFSQFENVGSILLAMDNLSYTVPETIGLPSVVLSLCGVLFLHRPIKASSAYRGL